LEEPAFESVLAPYFEEFLEMKLSLGYKYTSQKALLLRFDRFCEAFPLRECTLSKDVVSAWVEKRPNEAAATQGHRISIAREFAGFLSNHGISAFVLPPSVRIEPKDEFVPYIFTHRQVDGFLAAADQRPNHIAHPMSSEMYSVLFRLLYSSGLRISEALKLELKDIDEKTETLTIRESKFGKSRLTPSSDSMADMLKSYLRTRASYHPAHRSVFPSRFSDGPVESRVVYGYYRRILWEAGIPHGGMGKGPRLHDLRHTFAVHSLQQWISEGIDIYTALPILAKYLGHEHLRMTEKYLRLTAEVYPEVVKLTEQFSGHTVPEVANETY
jgi:integrase